MRITWYGHACFKFDFSQGPYVVTDPFDDHVGYPLCREEADVVTVSHAHSDHNYTESLRGNFTKITRPGLFTFDDLIVQGVKSYHDAETAAAGETTSSTSLNPTTCASPIWEIWATSPT